MTNIELRNENGTIIGYDPETGDKIPISLEELQAEGLRNDPPNPNSWATDRLLWSQEPRDIYCAPDGDSNGEGTETDPVTFGAAVKQTPTFLTHKRHYILEAGTYNNGPYRFNSTFLAGKPHIPPFQIRSKSGDRSDVIFTDLISFAYFHGEQDNPQIKDVTTDHSILQKWGNIRMENIHFRGQGSPLSDGNGTVAFNAHAPNAYTRFGNCEFSRNYATGALIANGARAFFTGVSGRPAIYGVRAYGNAEVTFGTSTDTFWGDKGQWATDETSVVRYFPRGKQMVDNPALYEDFGDNRAVEDRIAPSGLHNYRPAWSTWTSHDVSGQQLILAPGDLLVLEDHVLLRGRYEWTFSFDSTPSGSPLRFCLIQWDRDNRIQVRVDTDGTTSLEEVEGGTITTLISGSWAGDTAEHTVRLDRTDSGYELFMDGTNQGTDSSTPFVLIAQDDMNMRMINNSDVTVNISEVSVVQDN